MTMTDGYGRGSGFLPRPPVPKDRHSETWHKRESRGVEALAQELEDREPASLYAYQRRREREEKAARKKPAKPNARK